MVAGSFVKESTSPIALERVWNASVRDINILMPMIMPDHVVGVDIIEGDGGVGTVKQINFGPAVKAFEFEKERIEVLDDANHVFKISVIEGGLIGLRLKSYSFEFKYVVGSDGSSVGKIKVEYDTLDDTLLTAEEEALITTGVVGLLKAIEGYLLADLTACV